MTAPEHGRHLLRFAGHLWPRHIAEHNFMYVGKRGSGKTLSMLLLLQSALAGFTRGSSRRALVYDPKGDMPACLDAMMVGWQDRPDVKSLHPFHEKGYAYDFATEFDTSANPTSAAQNFAQTVIPSGSLGGDKSGRFWTSSAQEVVAAIIESFCTFAPGRWTLRDVVTVACDIRLIEPVLNRNSRGKRVTTKFHTTGQTYANVIQTVGSYLWEMETAATAWEHHLKEKRRLTFEEWFTSNDVLVLNGSYLYPSATEPINALYLEFLRQRILAQREIDWQHPDHPETWMFLDEFPKIHPIPNLVDFFTQTRSKGGIQVLGLQEIDHLGDSYTDELANTILGQFSYIGILKLKSPKTAEYFERLIASFEERVMLSSTNSGNSFGSGAGGGNWSQSSGRGSSEQLMTRPGVLAQEFTQLTDVGPGATIDGWYVANGPYERRRYSAERCGLVRPEKDYPNFRPLDPSVIRPRPWNEEDFARIGIAGQDIPDGYFDGDREDFTAKESLKSLVRRWKCPE